jgi:hypothetical protein
VKKLLLAVVLSLFVSQAYALEMQIFGEHELAGKWLINDNFNDDKNGRTKNDSTFFEHYLEIWAELSPAEGTRIILSTIPSDRIMGSGDWGSVENDGSMTLDTAWIEYDIANLTLSGGRMVNDYAPYGWAQGFYNGNLEEYWAADAFKISKSIDSVPVFDINLWAVYQKDIEASAGFAGSAGPNTNGQDADTYLFGAEIAMLDFVFHPQLSYHHNASDKSVEDSIALFGVYLDGAYLPETGLNVLGAFSYVSGDSGNGLLAYSYGDDYTAWGAYVDVAYVTESFTMGALMAYSSYDDKDGYFTFGGDFDRTTFIDDELYSGYGVPAMTMAQLYGELYFMDDRLLLMPSISYYMSNISNGHTIGNPDMDAITLGEDTNFLEFDLMAEYALTESTTLSAGYALAWMNDLVDGVTDEKYDSDAAHKFYWAVTTAF